MAPNSQALNPRNNMSARQLTRPTTGNILEYVGRGILIAEAFTRM